jgi:hypothetical protein
MPRRLAGSNSLTDLAARIRAEHEAASAAFKDSVSHGIAAGEMLIEAKDQIAYGQWLPWLHEHCTIPERTAQLYMRLARKVPQLKSATVADLTTRAAARLIAKPRKQEAHYLPKPGQARTGLLLHHGPHPPEIFQVMESTTYPGYYWIAHAQMFDGVDAGGVLTALKKPMAAEGIQPCLETMTRHAHRIAEIKWFDSPEGYFIQAGYGGAP